MKENLILTILIIFCLSLTGCSIPTTANRSHIYSFDKVEKKKKGLFGNKKTVTVTDFRENSAYIEDMDGLKADIEKYISIHPELTDAQKNNLRELKVTEGSNKEEIELLLGEPDKIARTNRSDGVTEIWIYRINKLRSYNVFIIPVFFAHDGYYLHFKGDKVAAIQRRYLEQIIHQGSAPGVYTGRENKDDTTK